MREDLKEWQVCAWAVRCLRGQSIHRSQRSSLRSQFKKTHCKSRVGWQPPATAPLNPPWLFIPKPHFLCSARNDWAPWAFYKPQPCLPNVESSNEQHLLGDSHHPWCDLCRMDMGSCVLPTQSSFFPYVLSQVLVWMAVWGSSWPVLLPLLLLYSSQTFSNKPCHL